jgi:UDP-N-acetylmuramyl tripeptide synthase
MGRHVARLLDTRRLTGVNLHFSGPGAAAELVFDGDGNNDAVTVAVTIAAIIDRVEAVFATIGVVVDRAAVVVRQRGHSVSLAIPAPIDRLMAAADGLELAIREVLDDPNDPADVVAADAGDDDDDAPMPLSALRASLAVTLEGERNAALVALVAEAQARRLPFFVDDDGLTLGLGRGGHSFALGALPAPTDVAWDTLSSVPTAFITGTNGKTTTTRLLTSILEATGEVGGATSTDTLRIASENVESGDWSGPGGARRVLRDPRVAWAALETARGGLLRRGLAFSGARVAVITNVAADHLGEFGINDLDDMAEVKCVVARGVADDGIVVVNADDATLMSQVRRDEARGFGRRLVLFARTRGDVLDAHLRAGGEAWWVDDGAIVRGGGEDGGPEPIAVTGVDDVPVTLGGALGFNVENALAAAAAAFAMGVADDVIARGLAAVAPDGAGTPGRGNVFVDDAGRVAVVDFAHNPAAVVALWSLLRYVGDGQPPRHRTLLCMGAPGDRQDAELQALAVAAASGKPDVVVVRELRGYLRGRAEGEVPTLLKASLRGAGVAADAIVDAADDVEGVVCALDAAHPGDVVALTPVVNMAGVLEVLHQRGFRPRL